jgi:hypothetical protein
VSDGIADVDISCGQCKDYKHTLPVKFARTDRLFVYKAFSVAALKAFLFFIWLKSPLLVLYNFSSIFLPRLIIAYCPILKTIFKKQADSMND